MTSLNVTTLECDSCTSIHQQCQYCDLNTKTCGWCTDQYARVLVNSTFQCKLIKNITST